MPAHAETDDTQRTILDASRRLFLAHGYRAVSTRQIAEASGVTQAALYHFFTGKEGLYAAMLRDELARVHAGLSRIVTRNASTSEKLLAATRFLLTTVEYDFSIMRHDMNTELDRETRDVLGAQFVAHMLMPLVTIFATGQERGELRAPGDGGMRAERAAGAFLALIAHYISSPIPGDAASARATPNAAHAAAAEIVALMLHGLTREAISDE